MNALGAMLIWVLAAPLSPPLPSGANAIASSAKDARHAQLAYFRSTRSVAELAAELVARWRAEGLPTFVEGAPPGEVTLFAVETRTGILRAVILVRQGEATLGFSVVQRLWDDAGLPISQFYAGEGTLWDATQEDGR